MSKLFELLQDVGFGFDKNAQMQDPMAAMQDPMAAGMQDPMAGMPPEGQGVAPVDSEVQFENDFGSIAFAVLQDRAISIMPNVIGFEVVQKEDDNSKAVGIFGVKIGKSYYYIPVFFINGQVKGMDIIVDQKNNRFKHLDEKNISILLNKDDIVLGEPETQDYGEISRGFERPDFSFLSGNPEKSASVIEIAEGLDQAWQSMVETCRQSLVGDPGVKTAWADVVNYLEHKEPDQGSGVWQSWVSTYGGPQAVQAVLKTAEHDIGFASAMCRVYSDPQDIVVTEFDARLEPKTAGSRVSVVTTEAEDYPKEEEDVKKLVTRGFYIRDSRKPEEKSEVTEVPGSQCFGSPESSGVYTLVLRGGELAEAKIMLPTTADTKAVVISGDQRFTADPGALMVLGDRKSAIEPGEPLGSVETGKDYALLSPEGNVALVFEPRSISITDGQRPVIRFWQAHSGSNYTADQVSEPSWEFRNPESWSDKPESALILANHKSPDLVHSQAGYTVPSDWTVIELPSRSAFNAENGAIAPGTLNDIEYMLNKAGHHRLTVEHSNGRYDIHSNGSYSLADGNYKQACIKLVMDMGLAVDDAENLLKTAEHGYKARVMVKQAQIGPAMPDFNEPQVGFDHYLGTALSTPDNQEVSGPIVGATPRQDTMDPGFAVNSLQGVDQEARALAENAASIGQRQVFDHAAIGSLSRLYDIDSYLDSVSPILDKAIDALGRVLFLYHWQSEAFEERYGSESVIDLGDALSNVFKQLGDLAIKLNEKAVDGPAKSVSLE